MGGALDVCGPRYFHLNLSSSAAARRTKTGEPTWSENVQWVLKNDLG